MVVGLPGRGAEMLLIWVNRVIGRGWQIAVDQHTVSLLVVHWYFFRFQGGPQTGLNEAGSFELFEREVTASQAVEQLSSPLLPLAVAV